MAFHILIMSYCLEHAIVTIVDTLYTGFTKTNSGSQEAAYEDIKDIIVNKNHITNIDVKKEEKYEEFVNLNANSCYGFVKITTV